MPAPKKPVDTEQITIVLNRQAIDLLERLLEIGLHGNTRGEVVRSLVSAQLEELVARRLLELKR